MAPFQFDPHELVVAGAISAGMLLVLLLAKAFALRQLDQLGANAHLQFLSYPKELVAATRLPFMLGVAFLVGLNRLDFTARQDRWLQYAWIAVLLVQVALWGNRVIVVAVGRTFEQQRATNPGAATHLALVGMVARIFLWTVACLILLDNFGVNISALVASLGIGGIAVALAAQNILGDLFSSVSIALDKPFTLGDFIIVGDYKGTVEHVGMKTTRMRSLDGEQIIISNSELLKNQIRNYKRMQERRILFEFGIAYETATEIVEQLPQVIREIIVASPETARFDRAHFKGFGDSALLFEVVYYVLSPDYGQYMDIQQAINLALLRQLGERGVEFAYPTRTLRIVAPINLSAGDPAPNEAGRTSALRSSTH
jgi:small-conductance mechanosensitive channel